MYGQATQTTPTPTTMSTKNTANITTDQAIQAIREGHFVSAPYHVEGYGPGKSCHIWGAPVLGTAGGPEGYITLGVSDDGTLIIDEHDDWCPTGMRGAPAGDGGRHISRDDED